MTTQEIVVFDNNEKAGLHISFCDKDLFLTTRTAEGQYDFQISAEVLMGLRTIYQEHCKNVDSYDNRNEVQHRG
jgi:hypothetical protein